MTGFVGALSGWLLFVGLVAATGSTATRWLIAPRLTRSSPHERDALLSAALRVGRVAGALLLVGFALVFARQLSEFRDPFVPWTEDAAVLLSTGWGRAWTLLAPAGLIAAVAFAFARPQGRAALGVAALAVLAADAYPALTGHAAGGDLRLVTLPADFLHVVAAGTWIGGLICVLAAERRWRRAHADDPDASALPALVPPFSRLALVSVTLIIATGTMAAWIHLGSPSALLGTAYGRVLSVKLLVVAVVFAAGAWNWRRLSPGLDGGETRGALRRAATLEIVLAQAVLLITAVLVRMSPMDHP